MSDRRAGQLDDLAAAVLAALCGVHAPDEAAEAGAQLPGSGCDAD